LAGGRYRIRRDLSRGWPAGGCRALPLGQWGTRLALFSAPVEASAARAMGCYLITETMNRRHEIAMSSYDRLFPNQDTLPRGGFGNLIALPLQHEPRQQGNSVFVDIQLEPYSDQWAYLASIERIAPETVAAIARDAARSGQVVGARGTGTGEDETMAAPWHLPPSGKQSKTVLTGIALPDTVRAVLAQSLFIDKADLPSLLLSQLKRLATTVRLRTGNF